MQRYIIITTLILVLLLCACGRKSNEDVNMEQLQREQGIPIRTLTVEPQTFRQELLYNAVLNGMEETTAQAMVGDVVSSISARVGEYVSKGQVIVSFPRNTPAAQYEQASTAFNAQKQAYERMQRLYAQGAISRQDLDNMETAYKVAQANLDASEQMINVRAPISGVITNIMVNTAQKVFPGTDLFTVSTNAGYKATLMVPEAEVVRLRNGTPATATVGETTLKGRVSQIALEVDQGSKAVRVGVDFPGTNRNVKFGTTAQISLEVLTKKDVIVVKREHIVSENDKHYVWVFQSGTNRTPPAAHKREIEVGLDNKLEYEVISGLEPGDKLIIEGITMLQADALVREIE